MAASSATTIEKGLGSNHVLAVVLLLAGVIRIYLRDQPSQTSVEGYLIAGGEVMDFAFIGIGGYLLVKK